MSVWAMTWVWEHSPTAGTQRLVLLAIADAADDGGGNAWPSMATLARKTRLDVRTVQRVIRRLVAGGHLHVAAAAGRGGTNVYTLLQTPPGRAGAEAGDDGAPPAPPPDGVGAADDPRHPAGGGAAVSPPPRHPGHQPPGAVATRTSWNVREPPPAGAPPTPGPTAGAPGGGGRSPDGAEPHRGDVPPGVVGDAGAGVLAALGPRWPLTGRQTRRLAGPVAAALAAGWSPPALVAVLAANPSGVRAPYTVLRARLADLPPPPAAARPAPPRPTWCGGCEERTRLRERPDGRATRCPSCHPLTAGDPAAPGGRGQEPHHLQRQPDSLPRPPHDQHDGIPMPVELRPGALPPGCNQAPHPGPQMRPTVTVPAGVR